MDKSLRFVVLGIFTIAVYGFLPGLVGGVIITVMGSAATISGMKDLRDWWRLLRTDAVPIDEAVTTSGVVQIRGEVRPPQPSDAVISPIHGDECIAYEYNITRQVQGTGDPSIDSGIECNPFIVADETAEIYVAPTEESLSLAKEITTVTGTEEMLERVDEERLDLGPSADAGKSGLTRDYIELIEGTISVGEEVTVVGNANPAPESGTVDTDAVMTPAADDLIVATDEPGTTALRTGARGFFLLILGFGAGIVGVSALLSNISDLVLIISAPL